MSKYLTWEVQRLSGTVWMTTESETIAVSDYDFPEELARRVLIY
ncbi:hypothetical protein [Streptomyces sp. NPDC127020]